MSDPFDAWLLTTNDYDLRNAFNAGRAYERKHNLEVIDEYFEEELEKIKSNILHRSGAWVAEDTDESFDNSGSY